MGAISTSWLTALVGFNFLSTGSITKVIFSTDSVSTKDISINSNAGLRWNRLTECYQISELAKSQHWLKASLTLGEVWDFIPWPIKSDIVSSTARHRCDVSL